MSIYDDFRTLAGELLREFDQGGISLMVYTAGSGPSYDPGAPTYKSNSVNGVAKGVDAELLKDSLIQSSDKVVTIPASSGLAPKMEDRVKVGGKDHGIVKIITTPAAGTAVVYKLVVRL